MMRRLLPLLLLAGPALAQSGVLDIPVRVTGSIDRAGTYRHAGDARHRCGALTVSGFANGRPVHLPAQWQVLFNPDGAPPEASFSLTFPLEAPDSVPALVRMTAGGRVWDSAGLDFRSSITAAPDRLGGEFTLQGLRPAEGGPERITVIGTWRCPPG